MCLRGWSSSYLSPADQQKHSFLKVEILPASWNSCPPQILLCAPGCVRCVNRLWEHGRLVFQVPAPSTPCGSSRPAFYRWCVWKKSESTRCSSRQIEVRIMCLGSSAWHLLSWFLYFFVLGGWDLLVRKWMTPSAVWYEILQWEEGERNIYRRGILAVGLLCKFDGLRREI